jgi:NTP pyrophosphatase (non-canonical NTP hydrolase)
MVDESEPMTLEQCQRLIDTMYSNKDRARGSSATFLWLCEEIGELAAAIREGTTADRSDEFADVLAWLLTLANVEGISVAQAFAAKYARGCPGCGRMECVCNEKP